MKKALWIGILAVILTVFLFAVAASADELVLDESVTWTPTEWENSTEYSFISQTDAVYQISFAAANEETVIGRLGLSGAFNDISCDETIRTIAFSSSAGEENSFSLYYDWYEGTGEPAITVTVTLFDGIIPRFSGYDHCFVAYDTNATMYASAKTNHPVYYQWGTIGENGEKTPIAGKTGNRCTVEHVRQYAEYYCDFSNDYGASETMKFSIGVANNLQLSLESDSQINLTPMDQIDLQVTGSCNEGEISYQWYRDGEAIEGATSPHYEAPALGGGWEYTCEAQDIYGNKASATSHIYYENSLHAVTDPAFPQCIMPDGTLHVGVNVTALDTEGVTYQWARQTYTGNGCY